MKTIKKTISPPSPTPACAFIAELGIMFVGTSKNTKPGPIRLIWLFSSFFI